MSPQAGAGLPERSADLPPLREVIARHRLSARRGLGQNFLLDPNLLEAIARDAQVGSGDRVVEVGTGLGFLTRALLGTGATCT